MNRSQGQMMITRQAAQPRESRYQQARRIITHSRVYYFLMPIPFNSIVGESQTAYSNAVNFDALMLAAWTDLTQARVTLSQTDSDWSYSVPPIPVRSWFGAPNEWMPFHWFRPPLFLDAETTMKGVFTNSAGEAAGNAVFFGNKMEMRDQRGNIIARGDEQFSVNETQPYQLLMDLGSTAPVTDKCVDHLLIWGLSTNLDTSTITGTISNETDGYAWSSKPIPIRGMCGQDGQPNPMFRFHQPYFLPANTNLKINASATAAGAFIAFECERILH